MIESSLENGTFDPSIIDFEWYASDQTSEIAVFFSGGESFIPQSIIDEKLDTSIAKYFDTFSDIYRTKNAGQINYDNISKTFLSSNFRNRYINSVQEVCRLGFYFYDSCIEGKYLKIGSPTKPLKIEELPQHITNKLHKTIMKNNSFKFRDLINESDF